MLYLIIKMKKIHKQTIKTSVISLLTVVMFSWPIFADDKEEVDTAILPSDSSITSLLNMILLILTAGVGIAAVISFVVAGLMYSSAAGNADQVKKAKNMILNTIIGLGAYALMWAFIQWLIPGGVL